MPELPEVQAMCALLERHCKGRCIERVVARVGGGPRDGKFDTIVIADGVRERDLVEAIAGRRVVGLMRLGKYLCMKLSGSGPHLVFHCGMTGSLSVDGVERFGFQSFSVDEAWPPRFTKLLIELRRSGGPTAKVAFSDPRRLGRIFLRADPMAEAPLSRLAPDPVASSPLLPVEAFADGLARAKGPVKAVLLDQAKVVCGVGNWIADEALSPQQRHAVVLPDNTALKFAVVCGRTTLFAPALVGHGSGDRSGAGAAKTAAPRVGRAPKDLKSSRRPPLRRPAAALAPIRLGVARRHPAKRRKLAE
eukprot:CAMPEP_0176117812 /NCGR_PEP_ID=MMETSP0120_2-20121206/59193_1 /TAXON_ID=160619 /ORGANISM="Kryptoperidinium foliaceum, Strain CCMP 1326" /LENGTH=304 /DNA_ID=CAMNT_0017452119 /DNA_START=1 /DNA_END=915 /DNA_ORIENTATION=-